MGGFPNPVAVKMIAQAANQIAEAEERGATKANQTFRFLGCDQAQLQWLIRDHEARTGLRAETIDCRASCGWQPIGTAPRDGTPVLLWCAFTPDYRSKDSEAVTAHWYQPGGRPGAHEAWALVQVGGYAIDDEVCGEPVYWLPLPAGPQ